MANAFMTEEEITNKVSDIIRSMAGQAKEKINSVDDDLFTIKALDSMMIVGLLTTLEEVFKTQIPPTEFKPTNFTTIRNISQMIYRLKSPEA